jgi:ATP-dependent helicase/nuclease subunit B
MGEKAMRWGGGPSPDLELFGKRPSEMLKHLIVTGLVEGDLSLVRALCSRTSEILVTTPASDSITLARLRTVLETEIVDLDSSPARSPALRVDERGSLARVQHHLFNDHSPVQVTEPDDQVVIFSAPGESRECVEIARRALALARDGVAFDRMAVLLRSPEEYQSHLEEAFARAGVPTHFARGAVRPDPAGRAFHALLCCAAENLSARRFAEYLSLSQVPEAKPDGTPPEASPRSERWITPDQDLIPRAIAEALSEQTPAPAPVAASSGAPVIAGQLRAPRRWERLLVEAAVIGGRERWRKRIDGLAGELRSHLAEIDGEDEARAAVLRRTLDDLEAFAAYALPLIENLDALPKSAGWGGLDHLGALATRALRQPHRVLSVLSEFAPMAAVGPVTLNDVLLVVSDLLLQVGVPPPAQRYGQIFVGPVEAARGMSFEAVFVPGLAEKLFPRKIVEEPILLDAVRAQLASGLPTNVERVARERLALGLAAAAAERRLYLSRRVVDRKRVAQLNRITVMNADQLVFSLMEHKRVRRLVRNHRRFGIAVDHVQIPKSGGPLIASTLVVRQKRKA